MEGKRTIRQISLTNFLSYGPQGQTIELEPLNVLIGANSSGKSNFLEAFRFLRKIPNDLAGHARESGGVTELLWKGPSEAARSTIEVIVEPEKASALKHRIGISADSLSRLSLLEELIEPTLLKGSFFVYAFPDENGKGILRTLLPKKDTEFFKRDLIEHDRQRSIITLIKDPDIYPELTALEETYSKIQFGGEWNLSRFGVARRPQRTDLPGDMLLEDASNLGLILNNLPSRTKAKIAEHLQEVYEGLEEVFTKIEGNTVQIFFKEKNFELPVSTQRISEGALRYLCLLVTLLNPTPPPLICLEEPEKSLHPHALYPLADLLIETAQRTQLVVATQSDALISGLADVPETILVCERGIDGSELRRLKPEQITPWLDRYAIGDLWRMGELGGVR
jgi:predicted ATPase